MPLISVVIPVYKSDSCLPELYGRLTTSLETISRDYEIILIEDCGGDRSWDIITELSRKDSRVRGIQFSRNFGQQCGITAGLDRCDGDWVVVMDCDLQDAPENIPRLYQKAQEGYEVVLARRIGRTDGIVKRATSWFFYKVFNYFSEMNYDGKIGNFRIISRKVVQNFRSMREQLRFFGGMVEWMGFPSASIEVHHDKRFAGETTYTYRKLWKLASEIMIAYSDKPLRLSIRLGFSMSLLSIIAGLVILARKLLYGSPVMGWSSMIVSLYFIGGLILGVLGIIGIYLGKTFDEIKKRPIYIIAKTVGPAH